MADDLVGGSFDAVGVVPGAFDDALAGAVAAFAEWVTQDLGVGLGDRGVLAFRGK